MRIDLFHCVRKLKLKKWYQTKVAVQSDLSEKAQASSLRISDVDMLHTLSILDEDTQAHVDPILNLEVLGLETDIACPSPFKPTSSFLPAVHSDAIEVFKKDVIKQLKKIRFGSESRKYDNPSPMQRLALDNLAKDSSIVIRESDKGGNAVVLDRSQYLQEGK
ncbi:hypothetical protein NDU88_002032 [Pleurodeles waltl]|uniref:Uncharacterized protein n=1 Tax=Pleurodeles waltl TaxID=8319 RepID=A0AAV7SEB1_PLEWA|nr:hypothetical protein NDU88_002032 [Pleurodeles waltl]